MTSLPPMSRLAQCQPLLFRLHMGQRLTSSPHWTIRSLFPSPIPSPQPPPKPFISPTRVLHRRSPQREQSATLKMAVFNGRCGKRNTRGMRKSRLGTPIWASWITSFRVFFLSCFSWVMIHGIALWGLEVWLLITMTCLGHLGFVRVDSWIQGHGVHGADRAITFRCSSHCPG